MRRLTSPLGLKNLTRYAAKTTYDDITSTVVRLRSTRCVGILGNLCIPQKVYPTNMNCSIQQQQYPLTGFLACRCWKQWLARERWWLVEWQACHVASPILVQSSPPSHRSAFATQLQWRHTTLMHACMLRRISASRFFLRSHAHGWEVSLHHPALRCDALCCGGVGLHRRQASQC